MFMTTRQTQQAAQAVNTNTNRLDDVVNQQLLCNTDATFYLLRKPQTSTELNYFNIGH